MAFELTEADKAGMTHDEIALLTGPDADKLLAAHGGEDDGAHSDAPPDDLADQAATDEAAALDVTPNSTDELPNADELAELMADEVPTPSTAPAPAPAPTPFKVDGPADYKAERQALRAEAAKVEEKWSNGYMTDEDRVSELARIEDARDDLLISHTRAETLRNANEQAAEKGMNDAVLAVLADAKKAGTVDYSADARAAKQFDQFLNMLANDPENYSKSSLELTRDAHRSVMALRGIAEKAAVTPLVVPAPVAAQIPPARRDVPRVTLSGLPNAAPVGLEDTAMEKFSTLEGEDAEDYLASLPKHEQDRILRVADAGAMKHAGDARTLRGRARAA